MNPAAMGVPAIEITGCSLPWLALKQDKPAITGRWLMTHDCTRTATPMMDLFKGPDMRQTAVPRAVRA
jgi:hypothetical protein